MRVAITPRVSRSLLLGPLGLLLFLAIGSPPVPEAPAPSAAAPPRCALGSWFEPRADGTVRVHVDGLRLEHRAVPVVARVGRVPVDELFVAPDGTGFAGVLRAFPTRGDRVHVGYAGEAERETCAAY